MSRALITGIGGQDGSLLAELLLEKGYDVYGVARTPGPHTNLAAIHDRVTILDADLIEERQVERALEQCRPEEVYNLASVTFAPASWEEPVPSVVAGAVAVAVLVESIRRVAPETRYFQASSSELFGRPSETPQNEVTPVSPVTPYGAAKACAHFLTRSYRERHGLFACAGILYNHESERRPLQFLPRKVARAAAEISLGLETHLPLGDLHPRRDWGYARDYAEAMWLMLQQPEPGEYVVATGVAHSVGELVECAFGHVGLDWRNHVVLDPTLQRGRAELCDLVGDASRARESLGWAPSVSFEELIRLLVEFELGQLRGSAVGAQLS